MERRNLGVSEPGHGEKEEFNKILQCVIDACSSDEEVIVVGDLNGHYWHKPDSLENMFWDCSITKHKNGGQRVLDFCARNSIKVMNK